MQSNWQRSVAVIKSLRFESAAEGDLRAIIRYGIEHGLTDPGAYVDGLRARFEVLTEHPAAGRAGRIRGTRELVLAPFVVIYVIARETILVQRVLHGSQQWPPAS